MDERSNTHQVFSTDERSETRQVFSADESEKGAAENGFGKVLGDNSFR